MSTPTEPAPATPCPKVATTSVPTAPAPAAAPTADDAKKFVAEVDKDLRRLWVARDRAGWVNQNFITDDTEALSASGEEATAAYVTEAITKARRFDGGWAQYVPPTPPRPGITVYEDVPLDALRAVIDWTPFFQTWELSGH